MIFSFQNASFRDQETGLYNQAYFMEVFNREWHRLIRDKNALSILILDPHISSKSENGIETLRAISDILAEQTLRSTDITCRFNHNYFAMGLFGLDDSGTEVIVERIKVALEKLEANGTLHCNLSVGGVNVLPSSNIELNDVFNQTIEALELAQKEGKNGFKISQYQIH